MPRKKLRDYCARIWITRALWIMLDHEARERGITRAEFIRKALEAQIKPPVEV